MKSTHLLLVSASAIAIVALCSSMVSIYHLKTASLSALYTPDRALPATSVIHSALQDFERGSKKKKASTRKASGTSRSVAKEVTLSIKEPLKTSSKTATSMTSQRRTTRSAYASLDCSKYTGGPSTLSDTAEMVYWKDRSDASYDPAPPSTYQSGGYLTFEPDGGGWNNIRMAMETIVALAIAMNRTLVLPAEQRMYLLGTDRGKQKTDFSFRDFFPMSNLQELRVITTQEFLEQHAMQGKMEYRQVAAGGLQGVAFPPENRTDWNGQDVKLLKEWLRNTTETPRWDPSRCLAVFPIDHNHIPELQAMHQDIIQKDPLTASEIPPPDLSTATTRSRLREHLAKRGELCVYDNVHEPVLHFMCSHKDHVRMLVHFYAFVFFEDMAADLWLKRFVRDHLRYVDEIQCAAARIVASLRRESPDGIFDTMQYVYLSFPIDRQSLSNAISLFGAVSAGETFNTRTPALKRRKFLKTLRKLFPPIPQFSLRPTNARKRFSIRSRSITISSSLMIIKTTY
jgi:hypothetical protein